MKAAAPVYMLDTNAISDTVRHPQGPVASHLANLLPGQAVTSVIVEGELRYGIAKASATSIERRVNTLLNYVESLVIDEAVAKRYGLLRADLTAHGTPIGMNDLWIAAHALCRGLILVTDNESEFRRVPGLIVENWLRSGMAHLSLVT